MSDESNCGQPGCKQIRTRGQFMTAVTETLAAPTEGAAPAAPGWRHDLPNRYLVYSK